MRATFLCLFALQLAFAVMAMPRARAQDEGGEEATPEPAAGGEEGGDEATTPADGGEGSGGEDGEEAAAFRQGSEPEPADGDAEATTPAGGEEATEGDGDGEATDPPAEAVREAQDNDAMRAVDEAARNMDRDRNVAKQKLAQIGSAIDEDLREFDEKTNSRDTYRV